MAEQLIQIIEFRGVPAGGTVTLPHNINVHSLALIPDFVAFDQPGFIATVGPTTVKVTNNNLVAATVNVWLELKHSIQRAFGGKQFNSLFPRPFIAFGGGSGGGSSSLSFAFELVDAHNVADAAFTATVVPETAPIIIPVGWNVVARAWVNIQANSTIDPAPSPPSGKRYGGITNIMVIEDPTGPAAQRAIGFEVLNFSTFSTDGIGIGWVAAASIEAVGRFVSDGNPHTYNVMLDSPRYIGANQIVDGAPSRRDRVGLQITATAP